MKLHSLFAFASVSLLAQSAFAQQPAQPAPAAQPAPYPMQPGAYPVQPGAYPPGAYPPGAYPPGAYPQGASPSSDWGQGSSSEPTVMAPDGRPHLLPYEIPYDPDMGIPPGYKLGEKRRSSLAVGGGVTFLSLWVASCVAGGFMEDSARRSSYYYDEYGNPYPISNGNTALPMYIPLLGPIITIGTIHSSTSGTTALFFDGLGQAGSLVMFIVGMAYPQKVLKYQFQPTAGLTLKPIAAPMKEGGFAGLTGSF
jgi:hypothetical protein